MATTRFPYSFAKPPFRFLASHLAQDSDFLDDVRLILAIDQDAYLQLSTQLEKADAFLSQSDLTSIVVESLGQGENSDQIASIIHRFGGILHDADMDAMDAMDALGNAIEEKTDELEPDERQTLIERLRKLAAEPIGIAKHYKARQLVDAVGAELDDFQIICDIRPIFNRERERIDGAIPLTILRLEYYTPDGNSDVVEVRVTEKQMLKLGEKIEDAHRKLTTIKELLANQNLPIPRTKSTVVEGEL